MMVAAAARTTTHKPVIDFEIVISPSGCAQVFPYWTRSRKFCHASSEAGFSETCGIIDSQWRNRTIKLWMREVFAALLICRRRDDSLILPRRKAFRRLGYQLAMSVGKSVSLDQSSVHSQKWLLLPHYDDVVEVARVV